jgi:hypothetical protein
MRRQRSARINFVLQRVNPQAAASDSYCNASILKQLLQIPTASRQSSSSSFKIDAAREKAEAATSRSTPLAKKPKQLLHDRRRSRKS